MTDARRAPAWFLWALAAAVWLLDWLSKRWILDFLSEQHSRPILGDLLRFTYTRNTGVAFGLFGDANLPLGWVSLLALVVVVVLGLRRSARRWLRAGALGLILGGALGNLLDRLRCGSVIDFVDVGIGAHRWYVFNLADAAITIGVGLWALELVRAPRSRADGEAVARSADEPGESHGPEVAGETEARTSKRVLPRPEPGDVRGP